MSAAAMAMFGIPTGQSPDNDWISRDDYVLYVNLDGSLGDVYDVERSYGYKLDSISGHKLEKLFS